MRSLKCSNPFIVKRDIGLPNIFRFRILVDISWDLTN